MTDWTQQGGGQSPRPDSKTLETLYAMQVAESTQNLVYERLATHCSGENARILSGIAADEARHAGVLAGITGRRSTPSKLTVFFFVLISTIFGFTFVIKLLERGEEKAERDYEKIRDQFPELRDIQRDEERHERELIEILDEERLSYIGSMVLGLNDALVELTGALAGLTFALPNTRVTGTAGLITGIAASLSMGASEYLAKKASNNELNPLRASLYTGLMYVCTVVLLIIPYFLFSTRILALGMTMLNATLIILCFTFFVSVVQETSFKRSFSEMLLLSFGVAGISFIVGILARHLLHVDF